MRSEHQDQSFFHTEEKKMEDTAMLMERNGEIQRGGANTQGIER